MKPNFAQMSTKELTAYVLAHREDLEALDILVSRRIPDSQAIIYPSMFTEDGTPIEENIRIAEEAIKQRIEQENQRKLDSQS
jgi:type III secretory pathway lipoprotein EscJ